MKINRRSFLKSAALTGTALAFPEWITGAAFETSRVGLQVWSVAKNLQNDFTGTLKTLSGIGYKEVELYGPYPFSTDKDKASWNAVTSLLSFSQSGYFGRTIGDFKKALADVGLQTPAMHVGLDTLRNRMGETAEAAHALGQQYAGIAAIPEDERKTLDDYKRIADDFNVIGENAKKHGMRFYYHNHGYGLVPVDGVVPFDLILQRTDPSLVFLEMDLFWTTAGGADPIRYLSQNPGRYKLMHVKDMKQKVRFAGDGGSAKQWVELFPHITDAGRGVLDLKSILAQAKKSGVEYFVVENDVITNMQDSLEASYRYVSSLKL